MKDFNYKRGVIFLIVISAVVRSFLSLILNIGGEEAYYWTFALYPELGSFDQPPMIGWFIQLFTNNLALQGDFFVRLSSIVTGSANIWIIFIIGRRIKGESAGFYSALLYSISFYLSLIAGLFILPEGPQTFFYLLSVYFLSEGIIMRDQNCPESKILCRMALILAGLFIGLATLSKFSSVLLWVGVLFYASVFSKSLFKRVEIYIAVLVTMLSLFPVFIWNFNNNFIGFQYLTSTLKLSGGINTEAFLKGIFIPLLLNNPVNLWIIYKSLRAIKHDMFIEKGYAYLLLSLSLPVIFISVVLSLVSESFIYAASLGIIPLIIIAGAWISTRKNEIKSILRLKSVMLSLCFFVVIIVIGLAHHKAGVFNYLLTYSKKEIPAGKNDFTLNRYGLKDLAAEFKKLRDLDIASGRISPHAYIIEFDYKRAALKDYYLARPVNTVVKTAGKPGNVRKYRWITAKRGGLKIGESVYYIKSSRDDEQGLDFGKEHFERVEIARTIYLKKFKKPVIRYTVYRFKNMVSLPDSE